jgi:DNA anti-recombination protein RmuC
MKKLVQKASLVVITVALVVVAGCQEEQQTPGVKKARLIAAENIKLKKQLEQRDQEIEKLKRRYSAELQKQQEKLSECLKQKDDLRQQLKEGMKERVEDVLSAVVEDNAKLRREIKGLKTQITELRKQVEAEAQPVDTP